MLKLVVLSCFLAAASASGLFGYGIAPLAYSAPLWQPTNYRGPLSLAPGQPANILAADGRPLDTLDVNLDRAAHFTTKALNGLHLLKKRSVAVVAPYAAPWAAPLAYAAPYWQPYNYRGPLSLAPGQPANILGADGRPLDTLEVNLDRSAHIAAKTGLHILKKRSAVIAPIAPVIAPIAPAIAPIAPAIARIAPAIAPIAPAVAPIAPIAPIAVARTPLITSPYTYADPWAPYRTISYAAPYAHYYK